jgi:DNA-binding Xre family transcriptional regulator
MLSFNLKPVFQARGIERPYTFLVKAGVAPHTATRILNSNSRVMRLDHVELICRILLCEPNDLLVWTPQSGQIYPPDHPLNNLKNQSSDGNLQEIIASMPYGQLKEIAKTIIVKKEE